MSSPIPDHRQRYDIDAELALPSLAGLVASHNDSTPVVEGDVVPRHIESTFFDTPDYRLTRARMTLCRRTGGDDDGWHLDAPSENGWQHYRHPLGPPTGTIPGAALNLAWARTRGERLDPVARIVTERVTHTLVDATGQVLVELADDRVRAERVAPTGIDETSPASWREVEVALHGREREWLDAVTDGLRDVRAREVDKAPELARVLEEWGTASGNAATGRKKGKAPSPKSPAGEVVVRYATLQVEQILSSDPLVRLDTPDSVHHMRVATRRLRSALQTFRPVMRVEVSTPLQAELKWLAGELGAARDAEVMRDRLITTLHEQERQLQFGALASSVENEMAESYRTAHAGLRKALESERYHQIVVELDRFTSAPPFTAKSNQPAGKVLPRRAARAYSRLHALVTAAHNAPTPSERDVQLHEARKAAKKARYAGETLTEFFGKPAARFAATMETLQEELGEHQDSVVLRTRLEDLARHETSPAAAFAYGRLHAQEERRGDLAVERFEASWRKATKGSIRSWIN